MEERELEKKVGFFSWIKREFEEIKYVGFNHYIEDRIMWGSHHHKESHTSKENILMHCDSY